MNTFFRIVSLSLIIFFGSCEKDNGNSCAGKEQPKITAPASVTAGDEISLRLTTAPYARYYQWTGPNGFESAEESPVLHRVQSTSAGRYSVKIGFDGGCVQTVTTDSIIVSVPTAPCAPGQNTATLASAGSLNWSYVTAAPSGGSFFINAVGAQGDLEIEFPGVKRPVPGLYSIQPHGGEWDYPGVVRVRLISQSSNWPASSGSLYVKVVNNKITATFCNIPVFNQLFSFASRATGNVTEK